MFRSAVWLCSGVVLTLIVGPLTLVASQAGRTDPADLYIVVDAGGSSLSQQTLGTYGASSVGALQGVLTMMLHGPPT